MRTGIGALSLIQMAPGLDPVTCSRILERGGRDEVIGCAPDGVPVLSRGRHRSPRRGACFMEFASFLAGERWSDHPSCTHPLLAQLARQVNDLVGDAGRQKLVPLIPSVVGRRGDDRTWLTLPVAVAAVPILDVPEATQRVLAAGLLCAEQVCAEAGPELAETGSEARAALERVPGAVAWVERLTAPRGITPRPSPTAVRRRWSGCRRRDRGEWHSRPRRAPARPSRDGHRRVSNAGADASSTGGRRGVVVQLGS